MKKLIVLTGLLFLLYMPQAEAKRRAPLKITPVQAGLSEFQAPHEQMGFIVARDNHMNTLLWKRQIYVVKYIPGVEKDVQDVFIKKMHKKDHYLFITNEKGSEYRLDLKTLKVKVVVGQLVEQLHSKQK